MFPSSRSASLFPVPAMVLAVFLLVPAAIPAPGASGIGTVPSAASQKSALLKSPRALPFSAGLKIDVGADGICELTYESLIRSGVPVASVPSCFYRLFKQDREVPLHVTASGRNPLRAGDRLLFYGQSLRGAAGSYFTQFSSTNAYWLSWNDTIPGMRMAVVSGEQRIDETSYSSGSIYGLNANNFRDTLHLEEDNGIRWLGGIGTPGEMTEGTSLDSALDIWYWGIIGTTELTTFTVQLPSPARTGGGVKIRIGLMGLTSVDSNAADHQVSVLVNNNPAGQNNIAVWDGQRPFVFTSDTFPVSRLANGNNNVSFIVRRRGFEDRCALNWIEFDYPRTYRALGNTFVFKSAGNAVGKPVRFEVPGFSSQSIDLWDITLNRLFTGFTVRQGSGQDRSLFSLSFQDSTASPVLYRAQTTDRRITPVALQLDTIKTDWETLAGTDYLVIGPSEFRSVLQPLLDAHARNGLRTAYIDIEDIYNFFSSGVRDPEGIRSLVSLLFARSPDRPPRFLLLAGDCTHDLYKKNASRTLVPTHLSIIPGWGPASNDDYFGAVRGDDQFADLCVGRFPAETPQQMKILVDKTVAYIARPERGFWRDNIVLASGYEQEFTSFTNELADEVIGQRMNVLRMDADPLSYWYKDEFSSATAMAGFINAGAYALSFNGHGGGNVWSDSRFFSYGDIDKLHNGRWGASGRLPVIFSFTCLTGFFESVEYRSLGEELVRTNENGAICFYGASAYTSKRGNLLLNRLIMENALTGRFTTVGELIHFCEINLLVRNGTIYLPLTRQYNLLGDPALPWHLTPDSLRCSLTKGALSTGDSLHVRGTCAPVNNGSASIQVMAENGVWNRAIVPVRNGAFSRSFFIKDSVKTASGTVRTYAWNDSNEVRGWAGFSKDTVAVRDLRATPAAFSFGDSVTVSCALSLPPADSNAVVFCLYAIAAPRSPGITFQGVRMGPDPAAADRWVTLEKIPLAFTNDVTKMLLVRFRVIAGSLSKESAVSSWPIAGKPDLTIANSALQVVWRDDSLRIGLQVLNIGNAAAPPFSVTFYRTGGNGTDTIATLRARDSLLPATAWNGSAVLPDSQGRFQYSAVINAENEFGEVSTDNNRSTCPFHIVFRDLLSTTDTLFSGGGGLMITPVRNLPVSHRVFLFDNPMTAPTPLQTASKWLLPEGDTIAAWQVRCRPPLGSGDSLAWIFRPDSNPAAARARVAPAAIGKTAVMRFDSTIGAWTHAGRVGEGAPVQFTTSATGPFAPAFLEDLTPPDIQITVFGRELNSLDYIAKDKPFNIMLADASGVLPGSVSVSRNHALLAGSQVSTVPANADLRSVTVTAYPSPQNAVDSLAVTAEDLAGNATTRHFSYMPGQDLSVKFLSCHPNPFSLRARGVNGQPQQVRFAFELTGNADRIDLGIYTVTGKKIAAFRLNDRAGYQEVSWNGRDGQGYRIANGTYYLKLTARDSKRTVTKKIRIAKLEGY